MNLEICIWMKKIFIEKVQQGEFSLLSTGLNKNVYITNKNHTSKIRNYEIEDIIEVLSENVVVEIIIS